MRRFYVDCIACGAALVVSVQCEVFGIGNALLFGGALVLVRLNDWMVK